MEDGRVNRADVRREGRRMVIQAKKGIILNTGGFSHNRRMREENQPKPASVDWTLANPGDTGEMIEMAKALGAATDLMDTSWWLPETTLPENVRLYLVPELQQPQDRKSTRIKSSN